MIAETKTVLLTLQQAKRGVSAGGCQLQFSDCTEASLRWNGLIEH